MYCATCGTEIKAQLNYCNRCGARVDKLAVAGDKSEALEYLSMATGFVGLGGLGLTVGLIAILLQHNVAREVLVMITIAFLVTVFGISYLMIQQISRMAKPDSGRKIFDQTNLSQLGAITTAQLEERRETAQSVTENTTRTLDKFPVR